MDDILNKVAVEQYLDRIKDPEKLTVILLLYGLVDKPTDWEEAWPPTYVTIGRYIGIKFRNKPLSEATIRYIHKRILVFLRAEPAKLA